MPTPDFKCLLALLLAPLCGCSAQYTFAYDITIADEVEVVQGATLRMSQGSSPTDLDQLKPHDDLEETLTDAQRSVQADGSVCCAPNNRVNLFAYIDLDDSGSWDAGEPWGADPGNPIAIDDDGYVSEITVAPDTP